MQCICNQRACGLQERMLCLKLLLLYFFFRMCSIRGNDIIKILSLNNHFAVQRMCSPTGLITADSVWCSLKKLASPAKCALIKMGSLMSLRRSASNGTFETIKTLNLHIHLRVLLGCFSVRQIKKKEAK